MNQAVKLSLRTAPFWATVGHLAFWTAPSPTAKGMARILIVDDDSLLRQSVSRLLALEPGLEVIGEAFNGKDAVALVRSLRPDFVIMDVWMPRMDGVEATFLITEKWPDTRVVGIASSFEHNIKAKMLKAGAVDLLDKGESVTTLVPTLRRLWAERG